MALKNEWLRNYVSTASYERGHSAGQEEVNAIAASIEYDLKQADEYITSLEERIVALENDHC